MEVINVLTFSRGRGSGYNVWFYVLHRVCGESNSITRTLSIICVIQKQVGVFGDWHFLPVRFTQCIRTMAIFIVSPFTDDDLPCACTVGRLVLCLVSVLNGNDRL